jgi:hypothetical protein
MSIADKVLVISERTAEAELKPEEEQYGVESTPCHFFSLQNKTNINSN